MLNCRTRNELMRGSLTTKSQRPQRQRRITSSGWANDLQHLPRGGKPIIPARPCPRPPKSAPPAFDEKILAGPRSNAPHIGSGRPCPCAVRPHKLTCPPAS